MVTLNCHISPKLNSSQLRSKTFLIMLVQAISSPTWSVCVPRIRPWVKILNKKQIKQYLLINITWSFIHYYCNNCWKVFQSDLSYSSFFINSESWWGKSVFWVVPYIFKYWLLSPYFVNKIIIDYMSLTFLSIYLCIGMLNFLFLYSYPSCSGAVAPGLAADMHFKDDVIAFVGPACAFALEPVARLAAYWNTPIITGMGDQVRIFCFRKNKVFSWHKMCIWYITTYSIC